MTKEQLEELKRLRGGEVVVHSMPTAFEGDNIPGVPENPEEPKASEGMEAFRTKVYAAIDARGWNQWVNYEAPYNFIITELYDSSAICQDTLTAKFFKLPIAVGDDGEVTLGDPEEYDITYTPVDGATVDPPVVTADSQAKIRTRGVPLRLEAVDGKPGVYRILICNSGFVKKWVRVDGKQRQVFITPEALVDAVANGRFDGGRCFWMHPNANHEQDGKPKRERLLCGYIVPKSPEVSKNLAGGVDVWAHYDTIGTPDGIGVKAVIEKQAELRKVGIDLTLIENSIYSEDPTWEVAQVEGIDVLKLAKLNRRVDVDFVDEGAVPRASVYGRIAANASSNEKPKEGSLTMDEKKLLLDLQATVRDMGAKLDILTAEKEAEKKRADALELDKAVEADLSASGLTKDAQAVVKPILLSIADSNVRKAQLELSKQAYLNTAKATASGGAKGSDDGNADTTTPKPAALRSDVQAMIDDAAAKGGIKKENLDKAQLRVVGAAA